MLPRANSLSPRILGVCCETVFGWVNPGCPLNITTQLAPRDMRGREEAHEEKNKNIAVEYESLDTYSPFTFKTDSAYRLMRTSEMFSFSFNFKLQMIVKEISSLKIPTECETKIPQHEYGPPWKHSKIT